MKLADFATTILFEPSLEAKLLAPASFEDAVVAALPRSPDAPARPKGLELRARGDTVRTPFPSVRDLEREAPRGVVLHFFANHELLAMELMALALLRFPDAPLPFRVGIAQTIKEEQNHLRLYMQRMRELGVEFGEVPVNRFFWDCIAGMQTPMDYVTKMSMTLEQANLDFSLHYRDVFASLGDASTAAILERVYREEIGHVKHGVTWFNRWRDQSRSDWEEFVERMAPPMAASRAKGIGFDRQGRRLAGLSDRFIDELAVYEHSKGRPPVVYLFNPACEEELLNPRASFNPPRAVADIEHDLASLLLFLARADDAVIVPARPEAGFLAALRDAGFEIPQLVAQEDLKCLAGRRVSQARPWGVTPSSQRRIDALGLALTEPPSPPPDLRLFAKDWSATLAHELGLQQDHATIVTSVEAAKISLARLFAGGTDTAVLKAPSAPAAATCNAFAPPDSSPAKSGGWKRL